MNLRVLTTKALRGWQQRIETRLEALEAIIEVSAGHADPQWSREYDQLTAQWDAIEAEWTRRAAPIAAVAARLNWPSDGIKSTGKDTSMPGEHGRIRDFVHWVDGKPYRVERRMDGLVLVNGAPVPADQPEAVRLAVLAFLAREEDSRVEAAQYVVAPPPCDCIHGASTHDPISGACLVTNPIFGPCPCAATPAETREALLTAFRFHRSAARLAREQGG